EGSYSKTCDKNGIFGRCINATCVCERGSVLMLSGTCKHKGRKSFLSNLCVTCMSSGLVVPETKGNETIPEAVTTSGYELLHFFKDFLICFFLISGPDCSLKVPSAEPYWFLSKVKPDGQSLGRASHKAVVHGKVMWVFGGLTFNYSSFQMVIKYVFLPGNIITVDIPVQHFISLLYTLQDDIYMFGGKLEVGSRNWTTGMVLFGYSPIYSYLSHIQVYNIRPYSWSVADEWVLVCSHSIYVHGGYKALPANKYGLVDHLYRCQVHTHTPDEFILKESSLARYLHSAVMISGVLLVFGGNTHNNSSLSNGAKCFSSDFLSYDIACDEWTVLPSPNLHRDVNHFRHTAVVSNSSIYIFGGFSGVILNNMLVYKPATCEAFLEVDLCQSSGPGVCCVWIEEHLFEVNCRSCLLNINCQREPQQQEPHLCGVGWTQVGDACLDNAQHYCKNLDGNIASLTSTRQVDFILDELQEKKLTPWVGLRKINVSYWGWEDISPFTASMLQWLPGQPSDSEFCAYLERGSRTQSQTLLCQHRGADLYPVLIKSDLNLLSLAQNCSGHHTCGQCLEHPDCAWRCNNHANMCYSSSGKCYCTTKRVKGDQCQLCDCENRYFGNPLKPLSHFNIIVNMVKNTVNFLLQLNIFVVVVMMFVLQTNKNLDMPINASNNFNLNITWSIGSTAATISREEFPIVSKTNIKEYRVSFSSETFSFLENPNITFHVYVSNFSWPIKIQICFSQHSSIMDLVQFFVTFFRYHQQMASRSFASVTVALEAPEEEEELLQGQVESSSLKLTSFLFSRLFLLPTGITIASALIDTSQQRAADFKDKDLSLNSRKQQHTVHQGTCV
uniref:Attractin-like 1a n=1 Tax=Cyprinus carpio TaxID=7962 RepID=A0A8C1S8Q1_CYPCA